MRKFDSESGSRLAGLSGTLGAGKDEAARHLVGEHGFMHVSLGDVLRVEATRQGLDHQRPTLIEVGVGLREQYGKVGALVLKGIEQWEEQRDEYEGGLVISGIRVEGEAREVQEQGGSLVFVDAPREERHARITSRERDAHDALSLEEFADQERVELEGLGGPDRPHLRAVESIADIVLQNTGTKEELYAQLDAGIGLPDHSQAV